MTMEENARLVLGLRTMGLTGDEIADFILWIESGEEQYKPHPRDEAETEKK